MKMLSREIGGENLNLTFFGSAFAGLPMNQIYQFHYATYVFALKLKKGVILQDCLTLGMSYTYNVASNVAY
jgi:hypothetical protein